MPTHTSIYLNQIQTHPSLQIREHLCPDKIEELREVYADGREPEGEPPVLFHVKEDLQGRDGLWMVDGHHRKKASELAEKRKMKCDVREGTFEEAVEYVNRKANAAPSIPLTKKEIARKIAWHCEHEFYRYFTDGQIAIWCRTTRQYVNAVRQHFPEPVYSEDPPIRIPKHVGAFEDWIKIVQAGHRPRLSYEGDALRVFDIGEIRVHAGHIPESTDFELDTTQEQKEKQKRTRKQKAIETIENENEISDVFGNLVPERLRDCFRDGNLGKVDELVELLLDAEKLMLEIAHSPVGVKYFKGKLINQQSTNTAFKDDRKPYEYSAAIRDLILLAKESVPYTICPACTLMLKKESKGCKLCDEEGYITKSRFDGSLVQPQQRDSLRNDSFNQLKREIEEE